MVNIKSIKWKYNEQNKHHNGFVNNYLMFTITYVSREDVASVNVYVKKKKLQVQPGWALTSSHMIVQADGLASIKQAKIIARQKLIDYVYGFIK